ncbi:sensor histidine kinase [Caballeronia sp. S22]|uniref:sensor histidine kinase n=1 Tax=Caballeronia sp. S22 TaxID=3137182 RepID=UPI0035312DA8
MSDASAPSLRDFADALRRDRNRLMESWMTVVSLDAEDFDRLTYEELADHLPNLLDELCQALEAEDLERVGTAMERDARRHGLVRWRQGYRIEELIRELDLFHQVLVESLDRFVDSNAGFARTHERQARRLITEALDLVTLASIRAVVHERDQKFAEDAGKLERANHELLLRQQAVSELHESRLQITRSVAHDIRNFLNAFSLAIQLIERTPSKNGPALMMAKRHVSDMAQLVNDMVGYSVALSEHAPLTTEPFSLRELYDELIAACRPDIEMKGLQLSAACDAEGLSVLSDRIKVKQVALNLLSNATKYTESGEIELKIGACPGGRWYLHVADTGVGIAPSDTSRVFNEFERVAGSDIPGAGLGLAIVKELCRVLHGHVHFRSSEGDGTTFRIEFPIRLERLQ